MLLKKYWVHILITLFGIPFIAVFIFFIYRFSYQSPSQDPNDWATFATFISGTVGTVIGLVSIILLYQTLIRQTELSRLQQFETSFFSLLENQQKIVKSMIINDDSKVFLSGGRNYNDRTGLKLIAIYLKGKLEISNGYLFEGKRIYAKPQTDSITQWEALINQEYATVYQEYQVQLGHYFRHLYHIVKYVKDGKIDNPQKYIDIVQAQMSDDELFLTMMNVISNIGNKKFLPLTREFDFFENINATSVEVQSILRTFFPNSKIKIFAPQFVE